MSVIFNQIISSKQPEEIRQTPLVTVRRVTTSLGSVAGDTIVDSYLTSMTGTPVGLTIVLHPDDPLQFQVRQITSFDAVTGTATVGGTAFAGQVPADTPYGIASVQTATGTSLPLSSILQDTVVDTSVGPSNFFAAPVALSSLTFANMAQLDAYYIDVSGFTNGALLTATISLKFGLPNVVRSVQKTFAKDANNTLFSVIDEPSSLKGVAGAFALTLQSSNAGDIAVTTPITYAYRVTGL